MNIVLIVGIVLIAAAVGLLGFAIMQNKKPAKKDGDDEGDDKDKKARGKDKKKDSDDEGKETEVKEKPKPDGLGIGNKSFLILCTLIFWTLFLSASYWAYSKEPLFGLMIACASILVYAILVVLQEILKNLIRLNQQPASAPAPAPEEAPAERKEEKKKEKKPSPAFAHG